jgi:hypothetical protein
MIHKVGFTVLNVSDAPLKFNVFLLENVFETAQGIFDLLKTRYEADAKRQVRHSIQNDFFTLHHPHPIRFCSFDVCLIICLHACIVENNNWNSGVQGDWIG